jgi:asparagine synthase (glutamine-hydrolysing)
LLAGISLLPPASAWTIHADGAWEKASYFTIDAWEAQPRLSRDEYTTRLAELFPQVVRRYFGRTTPIGVSLTGGLDGRMIMAHLPPDCGEIQCYTFGGPYRECADVRIARRVAASCDLPHRTIGVSESFLKEFPDLAGRSVYASDGCMNVSGAAEIYVNRVAREICPVRMTGNYGSEILRSTIAFRPSSISQDVHSADAVEVARKGAGRYRRTRAARDLSFIVGVQVPRHHYARLSIEESQLTVRSPFLDRQIVSLAFQAPDEALRGAECAWEVIARGNPALAAIPIAA